MGKGGVGKSSTVNSVIGERVVTVNSFQARIRLTNYLDAQVFD